MMWWHGDWNWWGWLAMALTMLAFWGLLAWAIVTSVRSTGDTGERTPEMLLAERFARGEIDEAEYRQRIKVLKEHDVRVAAEPPPTGGGR